MSVHAISCRLSHAFTDVDSPTSSDDSVAACVRCYNASALRDGGAE